LVRRADQEVVDLLPRSVEIVVGDVGDPTTVQAAVEGCNKIIYCATARSAITGDLFRVDHRGVYNLTKAFQVCLHTLIPLLYRHTKRRKGKNSATLLSCLHERKIRKLESRQIPPPFAYIEMPFTY